MLPTKPTSQSSTFWLNSISTAAVAWIYVYHPEMLSDVGAAWLVSSGIGNVLLRVFKTKSALK